jgi:hypothetical protein
MVGHYYIAIYSGEHFDGVTGILSHACLPIPTRPRVILIVVKRRNYTARYADLRLTIFNCWV